MPFDVAVYLAMLVLLALSYLLGHRDGHRKGYDHGFMAGHRHGQKRWIEAMETRRGPDGRDALLRVVQPTGETS